MYTPSGNVKDVTTKNYSRVRYRETVLPGIFESAQIFISNNGFESKYRVVLDMNEMTYKVVNLIKGYAVKSTAIDKKKAPKHKFTLLKQARRALMELDVSLSNEDRKDRDLDSLLAKAEEVTQVKE